MQAVESKAKATGSHDRRAAAEAALLRAQAELAQCLGHDIDELAAVRAALGVAPTTQQIAQLYMRAHDLKALGGTAGFPIVTVLAAQLCQLIDDDRYGFERQAGLVDDHIDALKVVFQKQVRTQEHPAGRKLLAELRRDLEYR